MRRNLLAAVAGGLATIAIPYAWVATASAIYCSGIGRAELFGPPFTQWIQVLPYWSTNWWVMFWVIIAAVGATGLIGLILIICLGLSRGLRQAKSLYGLTGWATTRQMADGGLKLRNKL